MNIPCTKNAVDKAHKKFMESLQYYFVSLHTHVNACGPAEAAPYLRRTRAVVEQSLQSLETKKDVQKANTRIAKEITRTNKELNKAVADADKAFQRDMSGFEQALQQPKPKKRSVRFANNKLTRVKVIPGRRLTREEQRKFSNLDYNPVTKKRYNVHMQKKYKQMKK